MHVRPGAHWPVVAVQAWPVVFVPATTHDELPSSFVWFTSHVSLLPQSHCG
jgi:hypothetical protein